MTTPPEARRHPAIEPEVTRFLDGLRDIVRRAPEGSTPAEISDRMLALMRAYDDDGPEVAEEDRAVAVTGGEIRVRLYRPVGPGPLAGIVFFHGGGFTAGTVEMFEATCRALCAGAQAVVASVDYRLAPAHRYPTAVEDGYAALTWFAREASGLGVDPGRLCVAGTSAGGNLAAVAALMARDRGGPALALQVLEIPVTDLTMSQPSFVTNGQGLFLTADAIRTYCDAYAPEPGDRRQPYASPLLAPDVHGLPPAIVTTAEFDPLRDEGEGYARRLHEAGVPLTMRRVRGHIHGSTQFARESPSARAYRAWLVGAVSAALWQHAADR